MRGSGFRFAGICSYKGRSGRWGIRFTFTSIWGHCIVWCGMPVNYTVMDHIGQTGLGSLSPNSLAAGCGSSSCSSLGWLAQATFGGRSCVEFGLRRFGRLMPTSLAVM